MLIETSGSRVDHDEEKLNNFLEYVMENGYVQNGTVTNEPTKMQVQNFPYKYIHKDLTVVLLTFFFF